MSKTAPFWIFLTILLASINEIAARGPKRKLGKCPITLHLPVCYITCSNDFACDGIKKCCFTKCGGSVCVEPIQNYTMKPEGSSNSNAENTVSLEKPGKCPNRLGFPICSRTCVNDMICSGAHKCCKTDCGGSVCIEVAKQPELLPRFVSPRLHIVAGTHEGIPVISGQNLSKVVKTGSCPRILNYPVCGLTCSDDQACDTTSKCCPTKCGGSLCVEPITQHPTKTPETTGVCPVKPTGPWICTSSCSNDKQCRKPLKCCKNRCDASVCMKT